MYRFAIYLNGLLLRLVEAMSPFGDDKSGKKDFLSCHDGDFVDFALQSVARAQMESSPVEYSAKISYYISTLTPNQ